MAFRNRRNDTLTNAKVNKNDEFRTRLPDIEKEMRYYEGFFRDKVVYCNCDDMDSNFFVYFKNNFNELGLKKLICSCYVAFGQGVVCEYDGLNVSRMLLNGDGDFRSRECINILKTCDVVVSNPPFSLFRDYVAQLMDYGKKFIIIGNGNAVTYKEIFPLFKSDEMWFGCSSKIGEWIYFEVPDDYQNKFVIVEEGIRLAPINSACWFTNIVHKKRNSFLQLTKPYNPDEYDFYDNYDAIEIHKIKDIPVDYDGVMGVPFTFFDHYCPEQFEIVGFRKGDDGKDLRVNGKTPYFRVLVRYKK